MKYIVEYRLRILMTILTLLFTSVIFANSAQSGETSSGQSGHIVNILQSMFDLLGVKITVSSFVIRKLAHFVEYGILGVLLGFTLRSYTKNVLKCVFIPLFCGLAAAVADECIQLFSPGRAGMVQDVVLDFFGMVCGLAASLAIIVIYDKRKQKASSISDNSGSSDC